MFFSVADTNWLGAILGLKVAIERVESDMSDIFGLVSFEMNDPIVSNEMFQMK